MQQFTGRALRSLSNKAWVPSCQTIRNHSLLVRPLTTPSCLTSPASTIGQNSATGSSRGFHCRSGYTPSVAMLQPKGMRVSIVPPSAQSALSLRTTLASSSVARVQLRMYKSRPESSIRRPFSTNNANPKPTINNDTAPYTYNDKDALTQEAADLEKLAAELRIDPRTGKTWKLKPKRPFWHILASIVAFTAGTTVTTILAFAFKERIIAAFFNLNFAYRLWRDDFHRVMEFATDDYVDKPITVQYVEEDDIDDNIFKLQQIWYHRTYIMSKLTDQITKQLSIIGKQFSNSFDTLEAERLKLVQRSKEVGPVNSQLHRDAVALQALSDDLQSILDSAQLTKNELGEFSIALAKANSSFAIDTRKETANSQGKLAFFQTLDTSVTEASLYIDRLQELLTTTIQQAQRFQQLSKFLTNREGYLEFRNKLVESDEEHRKQYDDLMNSVEQQLVEFKKTEIKFDAHDINGGRDDDDDDDDGGDVKKSALDQAIEQNREKERQAQLDKAAQLERELKQPYSYSNYKNQTRTPPAMHLDLDHIEKQRQEAQQKQQQQQSGSSGKDNDGEQGGKK